MSRQSAPNGSGYLRPRRESFPQFLRDYPHWLLCDHTGQPRRTPFTGTSFKRANHWTDFDTVSGELERNSKLWPYIVLTEDEDLTVIDVDMKPRRESESVSHHKARIKRAEQALQRIRERFPVRYEERSKSGLGFHIIVSGKFEGPGGRGKGEWSEVEIYTRKHGVALTGHIVDGKADPGSYLDEDIQPFYNLIKCNTCSESCDTATERTSEHRNGSIRLDFAREILDELARKLGRPDRDDWLKIASAVFDGVGRDTGIELMSEAFPEEEEGEYEALADSLETFVPWDTLRAFGVDPADSQELLSLLPDLDDSEDSPQTSKFPRPVKGHQLIEDHPEPVEELIEGVLGNGEKLLVAASSKGRKTFALLALAAAVQTGSTWFGQKCHRGDVLFINFEFTPHRLKQRIEHLDGADGIDFLNLRSFRVQWSALRRHLKACAKRYALIIIDPIYKMLHGMNENDNSEIADLLHELETVASEMGAAVAFSHHFSKGSKANVAQIDRASGAGAWARDPDALITLTDHSLPDCVTVEATLRHYKPLAASVWRFSYPRFVEVPDAEPGALRGRSRADKKGSADGVLAALDEKPMEKPKLVAKLCERFGCGDKTAKRRIEEAIVAGLIVENHDKTYSPNPDS